MNDFFIRRIQPPPGRTHEFAISCAAYTFINGIQLSQRLNVERFDAG